MQTTVTVQYVNQPREGKKMGSIKTEDGAYYSVNPSDLGQFQKGQTYSIEYDETTVNGRTFRNFKRIISSAPTGGDKEEMIFITGVVGRAMGSGQFKPADIVTLAVAAKEAWLALQGVDPIIPAKTAGDSLDDSIPY